jgi:hypothetical protein
VSHPDLSDEQRYLIRVLDSARRLANAKHGLARTSEELGLVGAGAIRAESIDLMNLEKLLFARIDPLDGPPRHIGRRLVDNFFDDDTPLVVSWHSPVAAPYYEATVADPQDLYSRRLFHISANRHLDEISEEILDARYRPSDDHATLLDALLDGLDLPRSGYLRDALETIQADQYSLITAPAEVPLFVGGGPGTGKTVVALHRAGWLHFNGPTIGETRLLVVGPSAEFLRYVRSVLPTIAGVAPAYATPESLCPVPNSSPPVEDATLDALLGDGRWADVLREAVRSRLRRPDQAQRFQLPFAGVRLSAEDLRAWYDEAVRDSLPLSRNAAQLREGLTRLLVAKANADRGYDRPPDRRELETSRGRYVSPDRSTLADVAASSSVQLFMERTCGMTTAEGLLERLMNPLSRLVPLLREHFTEDEVACIHRRPAGRSRWRPSHGPLLDELGSLLLDAGSPMAGHVVCDEAQDLSPMFLRALSRRARNFTVVADFAQATTTGGCADWPAVAKALRLERREIRQENLDLSYRVPNPVLEYVRLHAFERLRDSIPNGIREGRGPVVEIRGGTADDLIDALAPLLTSTLMARLSAIVCAPDDLDVVVALVSDLGLPFRTTSEPGDHPLVVATFGEVSGLEFDNVIVIVPRDHPGDDEYVDERLYVAMTRATSRLIVVRRLEGGAEDEEARFGRIQRLLPWLVDSSSEQLSQIESVLQGLDDDQLDVDL